MVAKEVVRFVAADAMFDDARPVRYSLLFDPHPMALPTIVGPYGKPGAPKLLKLREAILTSYHHNEVRGHAPGCLHSTFFCRPRYPMQRLSAYLRLEVCCIRRNERDVTIIPLLLSCLKSIDPGCAVQGRLFAYE